MVLSRTDGYIKTISSLVYTPEELPSEYLVDEWNDKMFISHGILAIAGYHRSGGKREVDMKFWNWKAITVINAHERSGLQ